MDLEYESEWPLLAGNVDRLMSFCCRPFSYTEREHTVLGIGRVRDIRAGTNMT